MISFEKFYSMVPQSRNDRKPLNPHHRNLSRLIRRTDKELVADRYKQFSYIQCYNKLKPLLSPGSKVSILLSGHDIMTLQNVFRFKLDPQKPKKLGKTGIIISFDVKRGQWIAHR